MYVRFESNYNSCTLCDHFKYQLYVIHKINIYLKKIINLFDSHKIKQNILHAVYNK